MKPASLLDFLAPDLARLVEISDDDLRRFESIRLRGDRRSKMTWLEGRAVIGAKARARTESLAVLVRATAVLAFRAASQLDLLEVPGAPERPRERVATDELWATRDALTGLVEVTTEVATIKRERSELRTVRALVQIRKRLERLVAELERRLGEAERTTPERAFYLPVDLRALRRVRAKRTRLDDAESIDAIDAGAPWIRWPALTGRRTAALAASVLGLALGTAYAADAIRAIGPPRPDVTLATSRLRTAIPDATVMGTIGTRERPGLHVRTGVGFGYLDLDARKARLVDAAVALANSSYEEARFTDVTGEPLAEWRGGRLWILDPGAPEAAP